MIGWIITDDASGLSADATNELAEAVGRRSRAIVGAPWKLNVQPAPAEQRIHLVQRFRQLDADAVLRQNEEIATCDKFLLIVIAAPQSPSLGSEGLTIQVRQLDCRTHRWTDTVALPVHTMRVMPDRIVQAAVAGFAPIGRIETVVDGKLRVRMRAARLATSDRAPTLVRENAIMQPISRVNDRSGKPIPDGIRPLEWTVLEVESLQDSFANCRIHSAYARPFGGKRSHRIERLAIVTRPTHEETVLQLTDRNTKVALSGYSVYEKQDDEARLLGQTDWRGEFSITRDERPIRTLFVRSGNRTLAKLPVIPGDRSRLIATMANDRRRAEVEGFLIGIQDQLIDLVVQREVLASTIKSALSVQDIERASQALTELKSLDTKADIARQVTQFRQRQGSYDRKTQDQVDRLFAETEKLLGDHLNPARLHELDRLVAEARGS